MSNITISILTEPQDNGSGKQEYFWCLLKQEPAGFEHNVGFGWAETITQAAIDAEAYYKRCHK